MARLSIRFASLLGVAGLGGICACTSVLGDFTVSDSPTTQGEEDGGGDAPADVASDQIDEAKPDGPQIGFFFGAKKIVAGARHTCALNGKGEVFCWGDNADGQIAQPPATPHAARPRKVMLPAGMKDLVAGVFHTCAISVTDDLYCWGRNSCGQTGGGDTQNPAPPRRVTVEGGGAKQWALVAPGGDHTCAVDQGGATYCWGCNTLNQAAGIGAGPVTAAKSAGVDVGYATMSASVGHTCAATTVAAGTRCWGTEDKGQLGNGAPATDSSTKALAVNLPQEAKKVVTGTRHTCALDANGDVTCWGDNTSGQLAIVSGDVVDSPAGKLAGGPFLALAAGGDFTCVIGSTGSLVTCAGSNSAGQLGRDPDSAKHAQRQPIFQPDSPGKPLDAIAIGLGREHGCAITGAAGALVCWGNGSDGQLGDGMAGGKPRPIPVRVLSGQ